MYQVNNKTKEIELTRGDTLKVKIDIWSDTNRQTEVKFWTH